jgi:hypothetical protein
MLSNYLNAKLSVVMLNVIMLNVIMLNVIMLNVVTPYVSLRLIMF